MNPKLILIACLCNPNGVVDGSTTCDTHGNCKQCNTGYKPGFPTRKCNTCDTGYYVSAGTDGINPTCSREFFEILTYFDEERSLFI